MNIWVNGKERTVSEHITVAELITELELTHERIAVEHNRTILSRTEFSTVTLQDGDVLEIVRFVGGG
ncbi:sulfur carrier protein ThiS [Alicyclobacillus cycloheptanicus]|uniref:Sulfur carrier protein n=1 Tax=Alicyclobacillus cycloheptanicus TaxID=1457 RepID=A0ABT9XJ61_9BACL|nr:sulfur carrier protein ThiS [Alicyclobacillus cycloheptanicus]MDQ0190318.1 sulfur carrier protein [Alicyclobacillus cycloheptanicus]WDM00037.1 sulfur carrier protein ThiS [Alicyclobacillus cycloheptanicus]